MSVASGLNTDLRARLAGVLLEVGWFAPWLVALHVGRAWWVPFVAAVLGMAAARMPARSRLVPVAGVAALAIGFGFGSGFGMVAAGIAAWRGWAAWGLPGRSARMARLVVVLVALAALVVWKSAWWPVLVVGLWVGLLGIVEADRPRDVPRRDWWRLGLWFGAAAVGIALIAYGISWWGPWKLLWPPLASVVKLFIVLLSDTVVRLLSALHLAPHHLRHIHHVTVRTGHPKGPPRIKQAGHEYWLVVVLAAIGAALLGLGLYGVRRLMATWSPELVEDVDDKTERRSVEVPGGRESWRVRLTRRVVRRHLVRAGQRGVGPSTGETVRSWFRRLYGSQDAVSVHLYEDVRYGTAADSRMRAQETHRRWPRDPNPDHKGSP
ncbi:MAG: hypothetical protein ACP5QO_12830 [Clostridia bacterium]